jgi:hypothetical protein
MSPIKSRREGSERAGPAAGSRSKTSAPDASSAATHGFEDGIPVQAIGQEAGEPALAAEERGAGVAGAGSPLVAVRIGNNPDAISFLECVAQDPFERAPGRVHLHCGLQDRIVRELHVGVAPAHVRHDNAVLAPELLEQLPSRMGVRGFIPYVRRIGNLCVRRAMDGLALPAIVHVSVAADRSVGRPLVPRNANEPARQVELLAKGVELAPECPRDLEIVALMSCHVEEGLVAGELEVLACGIGTEGFVRLPMRVAPEVDGTALGSHPQRIGAAQLAAVLIVDHADDQVTRLCDAQPFNHSSETARHETNRDRQAGDRCIALEPHGAVDEIRWIAPLVLGLDTQAERLPGPHEGGKHGAPAHARAGYDCNLRALWQGHVVVGSDRIGKHAELKPAFAISLQPDAG